MSNNLVGQPCADCIDAACTMNCSSAVPATGSEWIAASIWSGVFPAKASADQVSAYQQSLTAREPATADVGRVDKLKPGYPDYIDDPEGLARFREQVRRESGHDMAICNNNSLGRLIDTIERLRGERNAALSRAAPSSGHAMAEGERKDDPVMIPRQPTEDMMNAGLYHSSHDATYADVDAIWKGMFDAVALDGGSSISLPAATTPPTTNDAIPAGMVRWDGGDRAPDDWDGGMVALDNGAIGLLATSVGWVKRPTGSKAHIIAYTPKPSPTPKGGLPGRGEVQWRTDMDAAKHGRPVVLNSDSPLWRYPFVGFWNVATGWWDFSDPNLSGCFAVSELVNQWVPLPDEIAAAEAVRDGGEGGEGK